MTQLLSDMIHSQSRELKQRFFSTPLPQSVTQWQQLAESHMLDGIPAGVALLDENLVLKYQNKAYAGYLENFSAGASRRAEGRCFFDYLPGSRDWTESSLQYVKEARSTLIEHDHEINLKDGCFEQQTFWNANLTGMIHSDGTLAGVAIVCHETSFEKRMIAHLLNLEQQIQALTQDLEDAKKAIRLLSDMRIEDQQTIYYNMAYHFNSVIVPLLEQVKKGPLKTSQKNALNVVYTSLCEITEELTNPSPAPGVLTSKESIIFNMIKAGRTTKEIADILCLSSAAISYHRSKIRKKLGQLKKNGRSCRVGVTTSTMSRPMNRPSIIHPSTLNR